MKKILLTFIFCSFILNLFSQDHLVLKNGERIEAVVLNVGDDYVRYRLPGDPEGKMSIKDKSELSKIIYKDGKTEVFSDVDSQRDRTTSWDEKRAERDRERENERMEREQKRLDRENERIEREEERWEERAEREEERELRRDNRNFDYHYPIESDQPHHSSGREGRFNNNRHSRYFADNDGDFSGKRGLTEGYRGIVEAGYDIGVGDYGTNRLKFNVINGYQFNPYFSVGIGTGFRYYEYYGYYGYSEGEEDTWLIPFFADLRANFVDGPISPYLSVGIGYSFNASDDFKGAGFIFNPVVGINFKITEKQSMHIGLGFELQNMGKLKRYSGGVFVDETAKNCNAFSINLGVSF